MALAACDDESETAVEETGSEVEVADESAEQETAEAADEAEETTEAAEAEETTEAGADEAEETTEAGADEAEETTEAVADEAEESEEGAVASGDDAEGDDMDLAAADSEAEPSASDGESDPMQRYEEWLQGRWAESSSCESGIVELEQNALSLPGGVNCTEIEVADAGADSLAITGSSCEGAGDLDEVDIEVTQTDDGITIASGGEEVNLVRCE
ncbi:MAG TPA: hypothetical protein VMM55_10815 [Thermohalobaculum sp.]|nr:hypothetical protein [Thermohalobaculum sp.]